MKEYLRFVIACTLLFCNSALSAQDKGTITGTVLDEIGEPIIGAVVQVFQKDSLIAYAATDYEGTYIINELQIGVYKVVTIYAGFKKSVITNVKIDGSKSLSINIELKPDKLVYVRTYTCPPPIAVPSKSTVDADFIKHFCH